MILNNMGKCEESDFPGVILIIQFGTHIVPRPILDFQLLIFIKEPELSDLCPDLS